MQTNFDETRVHPPRLATLADKRRRTEFLDKEMKGL